MTRNKGVLVFCILVAAVGLFDLIVHAENAITVAPAAELLQAGDLIWSKKPGAIVPYNSRPGEADNNDAQRWKKERDIHLDHIRKTQSPSEEEKERYALLQKMSYHEFISYYLADNSIGQPARFAAGDVSVGHVGIIEISQGKPSVIEAMKDVGVWRLPYVEWLRNRSGEVFWVGRIKDTLPARRAAVATVAAAQIGKPYDFWDFDLEDVKGFYCSKLAWFAILKGTGLAPDDNLYPKRSLWYSPKQLMKSKHIELIANPGDYAR